MGSLDITTMTRNDPSGEYTGISVSKLDFTALARNSQAYCVLENAGISGAFSIDFEYELTVNQAQSQICLVGLSNTLGTWEDWWLASDGITVQHHQNNANSDLYINNLPGGTNAVSHISRLTVPLRYATFARDASNLLTLKTYTDSDRTTIESDLSLAGVGTAYNYFYIATSRDYGTGVYTTGYVQNVSATGLFGNGGKKAMRMLGFLG